MKSTVVNPKINNVDVFSIVSDESYGYVNFLQISFGSIVRSHTLELKKKLEHPEEVEENQKFVFFKDFLGNLRAKNSK